MGLGLKQKMGVEWRFVGPSTDEVKTHPRFVHKFMVFTVMQSKAKTQEPEVCMISSIVLRLTLIGHD